MHGDVRFNYSVECPDRCGSETKDAKGHSLASRKGHFVCVQISLS